MSLASIPELVAEMAAGRMVILVDDEDRENEGDVVLAAAHVTPETINFMARYCRGLICLTLTKERCDLLQLRAMAANNGTKHGTAFTVSIEAATGVTTGISAADRARTVQAAVAGNAVARDLVQPGHIFPLQAADGGVLMRAGHTEAGCDLAQMAGLSPSAVICEIMKDDGTMARLPDLIDFGKTHHLKVGSIADLIRYRGEKESLITLATKRRMKTSYGEFDCATYSDRFGGVHLALTVGQWAADEPVLVRVHEPLSIMDWLDTENTRHSWPLPRVMERVQREGKGVVLLLNCNHQGDALLALGDAAVEQAPRSMEMDLRTYGVGAQILRSVNVRNMRVLGAPRRMPSMAGYDLHTVEFLSVGE